LTIYQEETTKSEELRKGKKQLACLGYGIAKVESADKRMKNPIDFPLAVKFILYNSKEEILCYLLENFQVYARCQPKRFAITLR
jgi:hypothetical protein